MYDFDPQSDSPAMQIHFLGRIDFARCLDLQHRLVRQAAESPDGRISVLLCEHPGIITVGREGATAQVPMSSGVLRSRQMELLWVKRGGGCLVHAPGQLAVYPITPLKWHGFSVGDYLERLQGAVLRTLDELGIPGDLRREQPGIWGRTGQLVAFGVAVRNWVAYHGAFINVCPPMGLFRLVQSDPLGEAPMSCLVAERCQPVKMTSVRAELVRQLSNLFGCDRCHVHTGHPLLRTAHD